MPTKAPCHVDTSMALIRAYLASPGVKKLHFAKAASLRESMLRNINSAEWNPTANTLRALELAIPASFQLAAPRQRKAG